MSPETGQHSLSRRLLRHNQRVSAAAQTRWVEEQARAVGFDLCGVARVEDFDELSLLPEWLARGYSGEMDYLRDARRSSPARVLAGARSLIVCALNYNTSLPYSTEVPAGAELDRGDAGTGPAPVHAAAKTAADFSAAQSPRGWISRYAWGDDYHQVMQEKLEALLAAMREQIREPFEARAYVDTGPVVERVAAKYAGLGWLAKNTCLIHSELGSWLFLGVILTTLELEASLDPAQAPPPDLCGNCRLCIEACPTEAIVQPYVLDARRCISYLTIELRGNIPTELRQPMGRMVFGCDICQDVCPWNREAPVTSATEFYPRTVPGKGTRETPGSVGAEHAVPLQERKGPSVGSDYSLFAPELEWLAGLSEPEFREAFRRNAVKRTKWRGLVRNACVALGNSGVAPGTATHARIVALLERLAGSRHVIIAEHASWALTRLRSL